MKTHFSSSISVRGIAAARLGRMSRNLRPMRGLWLAVLLPWLGSGPQLAAAGQSAPPNVLFLIADDLVSNLGCYGYQAVRTPHIDEIAKKGLVFERAYCQIPSCSPSRSSLMTGLRPDTVKVYANERHFRATVPNAITLPQYFKQHGYRTVSLSKVFHGGGLGSSEKLFDPPSWSVPEWKPSAIQYASQQTLDALRLKYPGRFDRPGPMLEVLNFPGIKKGPVWEASPVDDTVLPDGQTAQKAREVLDGLKAAGQPFFLAVGFAKPHAPFVAPARYFERVDESKIELPAVRDLPVGTTPLASTSPEIYGYDGVPAKKGVVFSDAKTRELIKAYAACVAYVDEQVGIIMKHLRDLGLAENTIVIFTSDHGYHLGEAGQWCKNTNFEESVRVPLIVSIPGSQSRGKRATGIVELIDLYPTLARLCNLPDPKALEGSSFAPLFANPQREWKRAAFSQHASQLNNAAAINGRSIGTKHYRYAEWRDPQGGKVVAEELYRIENGLTPGQNMAGDPASAATLQEMRKIMQAGWKNSLQAN